MNKGNIPWNKGLKGLQSWHNISGFIGGWNKGLKGIYSKETLESNRNKHLGISPPNKGKKMSEEQRKKLSIAHIGNTGSKSGNWKGGISGENLLARGCLELKLWRDAVFARDGYTCQKTGIKGGKLVAHHIQNFSSNPELRFAIDNGITLSEKSHKEFHHIYGKVRNTKEQMVTYLANENL